MSDPVATYGARIIQKDGVRLSGDVRSGLKATVKYLVRWSDCFNFVNAMIVPATAPGGGLITYTVPYRLPAAVVATPVYAQSFDIEPCGVDEALNITTSLPNQGMAAGEFYSHAIVTVNFEQLPHTWDALDDPQNQNQLDPANPIVMCEQSVKFADIMEPRQGMNFVFASDSKPVQGEVAVPLTQADLVLRFPHVPYMPWFMLKPYLNRVNSATMFGCGAETLLLKSPETTAKQSIGGGQSMIEQDVVLTFRYNEDGWNKLPRPDGTLATVQVAGDSSRGIFEKVDFRPLFQQLAYSQASG